MTGCWPSIPAILRRWAIAPPSSPSSNATTTRSRRPSARLRLRPSIRGQRANLPPMRSRSVTGTESGDCGATFSIGSPTASSLFRRSSCLASSDDPKLLFECARHYVGHEIPKSSPLPRRLAARPDAKIRLAYLSADFRRHATAYLMVRLLELHDRSRFEVIGVSFGSDDKSDMRARLERSFDRFIDVSEQIGPRGRRAAARPGSGYRGRPQRPHRRRAVRDFCASPSTHCGELSRLSRYNRRRFCRLPDRGRHGGAVFLSSRSFPSASFRFRIAIK